MDMFSFLLGRSSGGGGKGSLKVLVVEELPETGEANTLYLVPRQVSKYRNVFDEYLYIDNDWEMVGTTDIDISGKQDKMQFATMPSANADNLGKIYQYIGTTNANYTNGYFYICVSDGNEPATYSWVNLQVQDSNDVSDIVSLNYNDTSNEAKAKIERAINSHKNSGLYVSVINTSNRKNYLLYSYINPSSSGYGFDYEYLKNYTYKFHYTVSVSGEWQNGTYTVSSISYNQSQMGFTALSTLNTTSYTPTSDYHPATKKYVDDAIASAGGGDYEIYVLNNYVNGNYSQTAKNAELVKAGEFITSLYNDYVNKDDGIKTKMLGVATHSSYPYDSVIWFKKTQVTSQTTSYTFTNNEATSFNLPIIGANRITINGTWSNNVFTCSSFSLVNYNNNIKKFIDIENTTEYNPQYDYNPSTKYYVDSITYNANGIKKYTSKLYVVGDKVYYPNNGAFYKCIQDTPSTISTYKPTNTSYWEAITLTSKEQTLANQKYVDDKPTTYTGYDATKTQVLKNVNGTLTWVDE